MSCAHPRYVFVCGVDDGKYLTCFTDTFSDLLPIHHASRMLKRKVSPDVRYGRVVNGVFCFDNPIRVGCGKCLLCKSAKANDWALRCQLETLTSGTGWFLTLTYDEEHCPERLNKRDLQLMFKRLRNDGYRIRYLASGEYGGQTHRPHYHAIIWRLPAPDDLRPWAKSGSFTLFRSERFEKEYWHKGAVMFSQATYATSRYVAKYTVKSQDEDSFLVMSRRPGIGFDFLKDHPKEESIFVPGMNPKSPPRYYYKLLEKEGRLSISEKDERRMLIGSIVGAKEDSYTNKDVHFVGTTKEVNLRSRLDCIDLL